MTVDYGLAKTAIMGGWVLEELELRLALQLGFGLGLGNRKSISIRTQSMKKEECLTVVEMPNYLF